MSLTYVTKKLEDQTLEEGELGGQKECQVEDSGTESDDETDKEEAEDNESEDGDMNLDSGVSLNLRSADRSHRGQRSRQLPSMSRQVSSGGQSSLPTLMGCLDDNDNHSSEEELEDIIGNSGKKKVYTGSSSIKTGSSSSNTEKRKWSEVTSSGDEASQVVTTTQSTFARAGSGSSGDEEVSGLMLEGTSYSTSYTPVQFCTSPPLDVYKPRKSQSPPPKLFHMSPGPPRQHSLDSGQRPSGAFLPRRLLRPVEYCSLPARQESGEAGEDPDSAEPDPGHRSPNKRHRSTPKPQNIQRPCLDFEKMQQIKTKVVTSWRQGTELSLFCW